ncbi:dynamin family protein [Bacillus velezensis]|uniref:dynamin family protein n=1 Tax=Bacillus velezensis TaxID=492670 RepID=UPI001C0059D1|nr:dynamin family protein [Bacillus velezensis]MEE4534079.1 dynamin family protein [Bacillus velezensis]QWF27619.1 dynamin family protein [Bacillus velezensis]
MTEEERHNREIFSRTGALYAQFLDHQDEKRADQLAAIMKKAADEEVYIAFTGHYSAGKSSLLNTLLGEDILPTSPIPTSANLVVIRHGEDKVVLHTTDGAYAEIKGSYDKEQVQQFCKDGEQIETVEVYAGFKESEPYAAYIDTPGIDSTDEAHFLSAASVLHQADALFYVVHYNHVHSEENMLFLSSIKDRIPNLFLIVNQIDRHDETETKFEEYRRQVEDMLEGAGIPKESLFFTSVTEPDHPLNGMEQLKKHLQKLKQQAKTNLWSLTERKVAHLVKEHEEMLVKDDKNGNGEQFDKQEALVRSVEDELKKAVQQAETAEKDIRKDVQNILQNANLMPFEMRELASAYIESQQPSFKTGLFFSKAKTASEKERRHAEFFADIKKRTEGEADWHIIDTFTKAAKRYEADSDELIRKIQAYRTPLSDDITAQALKQGAAFSSEYVLTYTKDLAEMIRREAKRQTAELIEELTAYVQTKNGPLIENLKNRLEKEKKIRDELAQSAKEERNALEKAARVRALWEEELTCDTGNGDWYTRKKRLAKAPVQKEKPKEAVRHEVNKPEKNAMKELPIKEQTDRFYELAGILESSSILGKQAEAFRSRIERLENRQFTLALFGGFSSGKSSFANALIGEYVLPSSPTPTTATINKITKPQDGKPHKSAEIVFKTEEELDAEMLQLTELKDTDVKGRSLKERWNYAIKKGKVPDELIPVIQTMLQAFDTYEVQIRQRLTLTVPVEDVKPYAAEEKTACCVKEVTVYYDSPLTQKGITIVDTPGASSINKRHTELAFQYIKDADAFFYMTYYQHSFSKGDRSFLKKLGLVKESFGMDKMFFVINAADLAKTESELETVKDYVRSELSKEGINRPKLYHVSSKEELAGKKAAFYNRFSDVRTGLEHFIEEDVMRASCAQLKTEADKLCGMVEQLHESLHQSAEEKEKKKQRLESSYEKALGDISKRRTSEVIIRKVMKDTEEQLYHIKHRLTFYANDMLKTAFHPGLQNGDWKQNISAALNEALKEFRFEYIQELKTLDIRMTGFIERHMTEEWMENCQKKLMEDGDFSIYVSGENEFAVQLKEVAPIIDVSVFTHHIKEVKSPKQFFEQNGKAAFVEGLRLSLQKVTEKWLEQEKESLSERYAEQVRRLQEDMADKSLSQIREQRDTYLQGLAENTSAREIEHLYEAEKAWKKKDEMLKI